MSIQKKEVLIVFFAILFLVSLNNAYADVAGCCINPFADPQRICNTADELVLGSVCCPTTGTYGAPGPVNQQDCLSNFLIEDTDCNTVNKCTNQGCCCSNTPGSESLGKISDAQCTGQGLTFHEGTTNCIDTCEVPSCNDGLDNDEDTCTDEEDYDCIVSGGSETNKDDSCVDYTTPQCTTFGYTPKITHFTSSPIKGEKTIELEIRSECTSNPQTNPFYFEIFRCTNDPCTDDFKPIATTTHPIFIDDNQLEFETAYTYKVIAHYSIQTATPERTTKTTTGNLECLNRINNNKFCIQDSYYDQYPDHITNYDFSDKLNKAFSCSNTNKLSAPLKECNSNEACAIIDNEPTCLQKTACDPVTSNTFGLFSTKSSCETDNYCFYDRSSSIIDSCFECDPSMSCYDYKTEESCNQNKCNLNNNCKWKSISSELGTGVCINEEIDNCRWCNSPGTNNLENLKSWSEVFEQCTEKKAELLSTETVTCYYDGEKAINCEDTVCDDYLPKECSNSKINLDNLNIPTNPSNDFCSLKICQNFNGQCKKNADGDNNPDCNDQDSQCKKDVFAPDTILIPIIKDGVYNSLSVQILDKTISNGSLIRRTSNNYKTYLCNKQACGKHPYDDFTNGNTLQISNLFIFDKTSLKKVLTLSNGFNTIKYYSQDPANNLGLVKTLQIEAYDNTTGPVVGKLTISDGNLVDDVYYTRSRQPEIIAEFYELATVIGARLVAKDTGISITPSFTPTSQKTTSFTFDVKIPVGEYTFELDAKNDKNIFMEEKFTANISIDNIGPKATIEPHDTLITDTSRIPITLTFNKGAILESLIIDGEDLKDKFSTSDKKIFTATLTLKDGNKKIIVNAKDFAGNQGTSIASFVLNARPLEISIIEPSFGIASNYTFDLVVGSDNDAECRYSFNNNFEFEDMERFIDGTGGTEHKKNNFNKIPDGDKSIHKLYVRCKDPLQEPGLGVLELSVDPVKPEIINAEVFPNPIVEDPRTTTFKINTNKETICKYSTNFRSFDDMENGLGMYVNETFSTVNMQQITVNQDISYRYFVACKSKSELISDTKELSFEANINLPITVTSTTPEYSSSAAIQLGVYTNKKAPCKYSDNDPAVNTGSSFGSATYSHTKTIILDPGKYTYYVTCRDRFFEVWSEPTKIEFTIDTTKPYMDHVDDTSTLPSQPESTWRTNKLRAKWLGKDNETKVNSYEYAIHEFGSLDTVLNWTTIYNLKNDWEFLPEDSELNLSPNSKYFFRFKAKNIVGLLSEEMDSDGIKIDTSLVPTNCSNEKKDPLETDIDCGGQCNLCSVGKSCIINSDCVSGFCGGNNICTTPTCSDNIKNQDESDIDCGGACNSCEIGNICNIDSDCSSNFCPFDICKEPDLCNDNKLTGTESDIDCGGACPNRCTFGQSCSTATDCASDLLCVAGKCSDESAEAEKDEDGDGIPDNWELKHGLNPLDPSDASEDIDGDGLSNLEEYLVKNKWTKSSDPTKKDTDGDSHNDKKEMDRGSDPTDASSRPKGILGTLFIIIIILAVLSGIGYGVYYYYQNNMKKPTPIISQPIQIPRRIPRKPELKVIPEKPKTYHIFRKKTEKKHKKRGKLFETFGNDKKEETSKKSLISKADIKPKIQDQKHKDVFTKLKLITKSEQEKRVLEEAKSRKSFKKVKKTRKRKKKRKSRSRK